MKRTFGAGLLALPALLAVGPEARAQHPGAIPPPGCGAALATFPKGSCSHLGCGGFCFKVLGAIHQHGPLFNYGPYTGYYPFEPYGPWNAALQYTGPRPSGGCCGWGGLCGKCGHGGCGLDGRCGKCGHGGRCGHGRHRDDCGDCSGWGRYAKTTFRNVNCRLFPLGHKAKGCDSCNGCASTVTAAPALAAEPKPSDVQQAGYPRSER